MIVLLLDQCFYSWTTEHPSKWGADQKFEACKEQTDYRCHESDGKALGTDLD